MGHSRLGTAALVFGLIAFSIAGILVSGALLSGAWGAPSLASIFVLYTFAIVGLVAGIVATLLEDPDLFASVGAGISAFCLLAVFALVHYSPENAAHSNELVRSSAAEQNAPERPGRLDRQLLVEGQHREEAERRRQQEAERRRREETRQRELEELRRQREQAQSEREEQQRRLTREAAKQPARAEHLRLAHQQAASDARRATLREEHLSTLRELVRRSWIRPPTTNPGVECAVRVVQIPGGEIIDASIVSPCNADDATRRSITAAVMRVGNLPYRGYEDVFERQITFEFSYDG
jgi:hypothetical protein